MIAKPVSVPPRSTRALERRARQLAEQAMTEQGCERVLIVYEPRDPQSGAVPAVRVYGEDSNGAPRKLEVKR
ncbi:MAG: hypothetical protein Q8S33_03435 [Myxococcales bacterium]|nr:hypothetical protein [Myxococcales bacterium]MDP3499351.1 hypothetical protein [Myxococcales bacterium]